MESELLDALHPDRPEAAQLIYLDWLESHAPRRGRVFRRDRELEAAIDHRAGFDAWRALSQVLEPSDWSARALQHYDVQLSRPIERAIACIKEVRLCTGWGLRESKHCYDELGAVLQGVDGVLALAAAERLRRMAGARVQLVRTRARRQIPQQRRCQIRLDSVVGPVHAEGLPVREALCVWLQLELSGRTAVIATR